MTTTVDASTAALPVENVTEFEFTAAFTGQLGSLGSYRFKPMVRIAEGTRYRVSMNLGTGATTLIALDPGTAFV